MGKITMQIHQINFDSKTSEAKLMGLALGTAVSINIDLQAYWAWTESP